MQQSLKNLKSCGNTSTKKAQTCKDRQNTSMLKQFKKIHQKLAKNAQKCRYLEHKKNVRKCAVIQKHSLALHLLSTFLTFKKTSFDDNLWK